MRRAFAIMAILLAACTTSTGDPDVFENPQAYVGRSLTVCGYVHFRHHDLNIWASREAWANRGEWGENEGKGLAIGYTGFDDRLGRLDGRRGCIEGRIAWAGCRDDCNFSEFNYGIIPRHVDVNAAPR